MGSMQEVCSHIILSSYSRADLVPQLVLPALDSRCGKTPPGADTSISKGQTKKATEFSVVRDLARKG